MCAEFVNYHPEWDLGLDIEASGVCWEDGQVSVDYALLVATAVMGLMLVECIGECYEY